jgi:CheY-like chemotaxis protein
MTDDQEVASKALPKVLWVDDDPGFLESIEELLRLADMPLDIEVARSLHEAESMLLRHEYSAVVADYCLDEFDRSSNSGAQLLAQLTRSARQLPKFAFSAHLEDPAYRNHVAQAEIVASAAKDTEFPDSGLGEVAFFVQLHEAAAEYSQVVQVEPERLSFSAYMKSPEKHKELLKSHWPRNGNWITAELKGRGYMWGVFCGNTLVEGSADLFDFPSEERLMEIGKAHNLVPFAYSLPTAIESVQWSPTIYSQDRFPRLAVKLQKLHYDDFDTGAAQTYVSSDLVRLSPLDALRKGHHLGRPFWATTKRINLVLVAHDGSERTAPLAVVVVNDWANTSFVDVNSTREVLIGRDVLRAFEVEIVLNSKTGHSKVTFI